MADTLIYPTNKRWVQPATPEPRSSRAWPVEPVDARLARQERGLPGMAPYMTTGKTIALTRRTFVGKVMSLLFNMLSWFVIAFLPGSKCLTALSLSPTF